MTPRKTHSKHVSSSIQSSPSIHISSISDHKIVKSKCHAEACRHGKDSTDIYGKKGKDTFQNRELELNSGTVIDFSVCCVDCLISLQQPACEQLRLRFQDYQ